jgi:hypothetical protein
MVHCTPTIGFTNEIQKAEIIAHVAKGDIPSDEEEKLVWELTHNLLHALGIFGHSDVSRDTACFEAAADYPLISPRDQKTLQLLYRCPISLTRKELLMLWEAYQNRFLSTPSNIELSLIVSEQDVKDALSNVKVMRTGMSPVEVALQETFKNQLEEIQAQRSGTTGRS